MLHINDESWVSKLEGGGARGGAVTCSEKPTGRANNRLALESISHLIDVHAVVAGQRASRCQVVGTEESWYDAVLVHLSDCGAIDKINQAILVHSDACWHQVRGGKKEKRRGREGERKKKKTCDNRKTWWICGISACMTQWTEHDGYMCQACLPIIQVTAKSTAVNNSKAAFLLLNYFWGRSGKGCIHTVYMHLVHLVTLLSKRGPQEVGVSMRAAFGRFFWHRQSSTICTPFEKWMSEGAEMTASANFRWKGWKTGSCHGDNCGLNCLNDWVSAQSCKLQPSQCGVAITICPKLEKYINGPRQPPHRSPCHRAA